MKSHVWRVALLLFGSGASALVYETVWLRQFRLIFGASTPASAAVLTVFIGGLGLGGALIGKRADRSRNPLTMYALLELGVAGCAALTPLLFWVIRAGYLALGGSFALGVVFATVIRLLLSVLVLGAPTFLMGATLPAASRSIERASDSSRSGVALLYAFNTGGAVAGALISTFFLLEHLGNLKTLLVACGVNALVGLIALLIAGLLRRPEGKSHVSHDEILDDEKPGDVAATGGGPIVAGGFVFAAAAIVGFSFLLMELVWYRMLTPLLGGTTFTFGLILAMALLGIGAGSFSYAIGRRRRATLDGFALCTALEALAIAVPFAVGDRVALFALFTRQLGAAGFAGYLLSWCLVAGFVILPAAFASGVQFPLLVSLLGEGRTEVGRHVGRAYAWNTAGSIIGSLAGGFGFLPLLTAPGTWRLVAVVLTVLVAATLYLALRQQSSLRFVAPAAIAVVAVALLFTEGPTAFWRHTPIGAGRADPGKMTPNKLIDFMHTRRRTTFWQTDGIESSVSIADDDGFAFLINGKGDGHSRLDAPTQLMCGLLAGLLHPNPRRAVVIGLGTGTTAGWLAALPSIERVDVVEIEPAMRDVAERCAPVNRDVLHNPKVNVAIGDGREFLLAHGQRYDVISAAPSNPFRAGIASLFTREFYAACHSRLAPGGIFIQFLQAYEVDADTIRTVYATLTSVFPHVETWQSAAGDLLLVGSEKAVPYDAAIVAARLRIPVLGEGLWHAWWADEPSAVFAHYVCGNRTAKRLAADADVNTDDRTFIEYSFARMLGTNDSFQVAELRETARAEGDSFPTSVTDPREMDAVQMRRMSMGVPLNADIDPGTFVTNEQRLAGAAASSFLHGDFATTWTVWQSLGAPSGIIDKLIDAEALANRGDPAAIPLIEEIRAKAPIEADVLTAELLWRQRRPDAAASLIAAGLRAYRSTPWPLPVVMQRALGLVNEMGRQSPGRVPSEVAESLRYSFSVHMFEEYRKSARFLLLNKLSMDGPCDAEELQMIQEYEPHVPWQRTYLQRRANCYEQNHSPGAERAARDLRDFLSREPKSLTDSMAVR